MGTKSISEIMAKMKRAYDDFPDHQDEWRVFGSKDKRGRKDLFFYNPEAGLWQLKGDHKSPYEFLGVGERTKPRNLDEEIGEVMEREGKPLPFELATSHPKRKDIAVIAGGIGRYSRTGDPLREIMSDGQEKLDRKLRRKVDSLIRKHGLDKEYG